MKVKKISFNNLGKRSMIFFCILFLVCLVLGYNLTRALVPNNDAARKTSTNNQINVLVIHVDDLNLNNPEIISIWGWFIKPDDQPIMTFKLLYISDASYKNDKILTRNIKKSILDSNDNLSNKFIKAINKYNFTWHDYLIFDQYGYNSIYGWLSDSSDNNKTIVFQEFDNNNSSISTSAEIENFNLLCATIEGQSQLSENTPDWQSIIPRHIHTNISLERIFSIQDILEDKSRIPICEIIYE